MAYRWQNFNVNVKKMEVQSVLLSWYSLSLIILMEVTPSLKCVKHTFLKCPRILNIGRGTMLRPGGCRVLAKDNSLYILFY